MANKTVSELTSALIDTGGLYYLVQSGSDTKGTITAAGASMIEAVDVAAQRTLLALGSADNVTFKSITLTGGTITADSPILNITRTWNNAAVAFTALKLNVTDSASAAGSLLADLQVGGYSKMQVGKDGTIVFGRRNSHGFDPYGFLCATGTYAYGIGGNSTGTSVVQIVGAVSNSRVGITQGNVFVLGISSDGNLGSTPVVLAVDAADTLAQRNGTNAQTFRLYNTYTDASNYERGKFAWESNALRIGTEKAGTGSARALELQTDGTTRLTIGITGNAVFASPLNVNSGYIGVPSGNGLVPVNGGATDYVKVSNNSGTEMLRFYNGATNPMISWSGVTSTSPALKRSSATLQARLADDSAFCAVQGKLTTDAAYSAGAPTPTGYVVIYDSTGTAYKIPAEAV